MKVAFLLTQSLESPSGLGRFGPLAVGLARLGHEVEIFALHPDFEALDQPVYLLDGVQVTYVAQMHVKKQKSSKSYYSRNELLRVAVQATVALSQAAWKSKATIIQICKPHPMNSLAGLVSRFSKPRTLFLDCDDYEAGSGRFGSSWQKTGITFFEKQTPHWVSGITTHTHFMRENLLSWGIPAEKIYYLPNGVNPDRFSPPEPDQVQEWRARLGLEGKKVVAYIGSLSLPSHPVDLLLSAFRQVIASQPESVLLVVGGGEDFERLKSQAGSLGFEDRAIFTGRVSPEDVAIYYTLADVSIDPVHDDPAARGRSPLKMFESWICGVPFITAAVGDREALAGDPPAALLVRPGEAGALADAILQILSQPDLAEALRQRGKQRVPDFYFDRLASNLEAFYLEKRQPTSGAREKL